MNELIAGALDMAKPTRETDQQALSRLAALSPLDYDRVRKIEAKALGVGVATLDQQIKEARRDTTEREEIDELLNDLEPWPEPVNGAELLSDCRNAFNQYCILPRGADVALALWVLGSYSINSFRIFPKICLSSPEKRCGKTTTLETLVALVNKALPASNVTPAVIFRAIEEWQPTLLIDEADTFLNGNDELRGIINSGHTRSGANILRVEGDRANRKPVRFSTWAPMAIAMIKTPPDTIIDRSIMVLLRRKMPGEHVNRLPIELSIQYIDFRRKCIRWAADNHETLRASDPQTPPIGNDRAEDNWWPMLAIADLSGGEWPALARSAMQTIEGGKQDDEAIGPQILNDIRAVFTERGSDKIYSADLVNALVDMEERPWCEWKGGKPLTKNSLAKLLKNYNIQSTQIRGQQGNKRGYQASQFKDAFARYLPETSTQSATTLQTSNLGSYSSSQNATQSEAVAPQKPLQPSNGRVCSTVALQTEENENIEHVNNNGGFIL